MPGSIRAERRGLVRVFVFIGVMTTVGYAALGVDDIRPPEAWRQGLVAPYVLGGVVLVVAAIAWGRGAAWARWVICLWYPVVFGTGYLWGGWLGFHEADPLGFAMGWAPITALWLHAGWKQLFADGC